LIKEAKRATPLHQAIDEGLKLVNNPPGGVFNIWPFVTDAFFEQLHFTISLEVCRLP